MALSRPPARGVAELSLCDEHRAVVRTPPTLSAAKKMGGVRGNHGLVPGHILSLLFLPFL